MKVESINSLERTQKLLRILFLFYIPILLLTLGLAWIFYPEPWEFAGEYVSHLGGISSRHELLPNTTSRIIMSVGFGLGAILSLVISIIYALKSNMQDNWLKSVLAFLLGIGAAGITFPWDFEPRVLHQIGAVTFIFMFAIFNWVLQIMRLSRRHFKGDRKSRLDLALDVTVAAIITLCTIVLAIFYGLSDTDHATEVTLPGTVILQKVVLMIGLVAFIVLDKEDMCIPRKNKKEKTSESEKTTN